MKFRMLFLTAAVLIFAAMGFATPVNVTINYTSGPALVCPCEGGEAIPTDADFCVYIMQGTEPAGTDPLVPVGTGVDLWNYDCADIDPYWFYGGGYIYAGADLSGDLSVAVTLYLKVTHGTCTWTSSPVVINPGDNVTPDWSPWSCAGEEPCVADAEVNVYQETSIPLPYSECIHVCPGEVTMVYFYPIYCQADQEPVFEIAAGCLEPCDDPDCTPGVPPAFVIAWDQENCRFWVEIVGQDEYCFCLTVTDWLAAELVSFDANALDNEVELSWNTASESNVSAFEIVRDGEMLASIDATNNPSGSEYTYVDETAKNGTTYSYELVEVDINGARTVLGTAEATPSFNNAVITEYALHQNFPNPFNPTTMMTFDVVETNHVTLKIYNAMGQEVATVVNGTYENGRHSVNFDAANLTSGLYFYSVQVGDVFSATKKMLLVK